MTKSIIVIPARFGSTRLPGKPLLSINGQSLLSRVTDIAKAAIANHPDCSMLVATDDKRIVAHCNSLDVPVVMTAGGCRTGTDRTLEAVESLDKKPSFVINLQGDAPFTPVAFITRLLKTFEQHQEADLITPVTQLSWEQLDQLRKDKTSTPLSGTTAILDQQDNALWFSKNILPCIRNEAVLRQSDPLSPVFRHIGLYGYRYKKLKALVALPESQYEKLEGLEQLRALENGFTIKCVRVNYGDLPSMSGIDSPEDIERAEALLQRHFLR